MKSRHINYSLKIFSMVLLMAFILNACSKEQGKSEQPAANQAKSESLQKQRDQVDDKYKWNLADLYETNADWEKDYKAIEAMTKEMAPLRGKLGASADNLLKCLKLNDQIGQSFSKLRLYASLFKDIDLSNAENKARYQRVENLSAKMGEAVSYIRPEIMAIPTAKLQSFISSNSELQVYKHVLDNMQRTKAHTLSQDEEAIMALAAPVSSVFMNSYRELTNVDFKFPTVKDPEGNEVQLSPVTFYQGMTAQDRDYRARVYYNYYKPYMQFNKTLTSLYTANIKNYMFNARARKYNSTLEYKLDGPNIPIEVYHNLVNTVSANTKPMHRWCELKAKQLGIDEMHAYDMYVTLFPAVSKTYTYDEAVELILKALEPMGADYFNNLKKAFDNRWIDVYETPNKRPGAYSTDATREAHPYVLLNWTGQIDDVFTLAHEMGHNMHSYLTAENQPAPYADYPIFLAEVASTTNEALLMHYLIKNSGSDEEKKALIEKYLNNIKGTFYRQTRFAQFELMVQQGMEKGEVFTADKMNEMFGDLYKKYWGDVMTVDEEEAMSWPRIHHFFYNFYVYSYATSFAASMMIAENIINEGQPAVDRHLQFLSAGESKYPIELLKMNGVDMTTPKPIEAVVNKANELLDELEVLMKK